MEFSHWLGWEWALSAGQISDATCRSLGSYQSSIWKPLPSMLPLGVAVAGSRFPLQRAVPTPNKPGEADRGCLSHRVGFVWTGLCYLKQTAQFSALLPQVPEKTATSLGKGNKTLKWEKQRWTCTDWDTEIFLQVSLAQEAKRQIKNQNLLWPVIILEPLSIMARKNSPGRKNIP